MQSLTSHERPDAMLSRADSIELVIAAWLATVGDGSACTRQDYEAIARRFLHLLEAAGLTIAGPPGLIKIAAERFAATGDVRATTRNKRLAVLKSFYHYAIESDVLPGPNPIDRVARARVQNYARARALDSATIRTHLAQIDRSTLAGARDYALLSIGLTTGRRVRELANLRCGHIQRRGTDRIQVTWARTKGNVTLYDTLAPSIGQALIAYLMEVYGSNWEQVPADTPVWISLSHNQRGHALTIQGMGDVCKKHLGTGKIHQLRHTFAQVMEEKGATVSEIQRRLGHASVATTSIYLQALRGDENQFSDQLAKEFGLA